MAFVDAFPFRRPESELRVRMGSTYGLSGLRRCRDDLARNLVRSSYLAAGFEAEVSQVALMLGLARFRAVATRVSAKDRRSCQQKRPIA